MDETEMTALHLLHLISKALLIRLGFKKIGDPIPQRGKGAPLPGMVTIKVHEIAEERLDVVPLRVEVPGRTGLDLDRKGSNSPHVWIAASELPLEPEGPVDIFLLFERNAEGEEKITVDLMPLQLIEAVHQGLIGVAVSFMNLSRPGRSPVGRKGEERFHSRKSLFESPDKVGGGESEGFEETLHLHLLLPDACEKPEVVVRPVGIRVKTDMKSLIAIGKGFLDRPDHFLDASEENPLPPRNLPLRQMASPAPGTLDRTAPAYGEMINR